MKIGIDITFILQDKRGMGRYVQNLTKEFLNYKSFDFFLISSRYNLNLIKLKEIFPAENGTYITSNNLKKFNLDLVFYPWSRIDFLSSGKKIVNIYDTAPFEHFSGDDISSGDRKKDQIRLRKAAQISDGVATISEFSKKEIQKHLKINSEKIKVIYPAVSELFKKIDFSSKEKMSFKDKYTKGESFILYVGSPDVRKNLKNLLKAFKILKKEHGLRHKLAIVTEKINPPSILDRIMFKNKVKNNILYLLKFLSLEGEVLLYSELTDEDLVRFYNLADLFIFPSFYEGFGFPVLEAWSCGVPVVCAKGGSLEEIAQDAAVLVDPYNNLDIAEGIRKVLQDAKLSQDLRTKGFNRVKDFSWQKCAREVVEYFKEVISL